MALELFSFSPPINDGYLYFVFDVHIEFVPFEGDLHYLRPCITADSDAVMEDQHSKGIHAHLDFGSVGVLKIK